MVLGLLVRRLRAEHRLPVSHGAVLGRLERDGPATTSALAAAEPDPAGGRRLVGASDPRSPEGGAIGR